MEKIDEVFEFYNAGAEKGRLERGLGKVELYRTKEYPYFIAQAYFHTPLGLLREIESVGFETIQKHAIEGVIWFTPCLDEKWEDKKSRERLLNIVRDTDNEDEIMGMSPHFMIVSRK